MKYLLIFITSFLLACSSSQQTPPSMVNSNTEAELLKKLEFDAIQAEFRLDTGAIAAIMDDRFISVGTHEVIGKQQELQGIYNNISRRLKEGHVVDSFYLDDFRAEIHGNTAIVSFFTVSRGKIKTVPFENRRTRFYDVWIKKDGQWKLVSMQATPVPDKS